jgi:broad specificity phosphatase PhoE
LSFSAVGRDRVTAFAAAGWLSGTSQIIACAGRKAIETAEILGAALDLSIEVREAMRENDRSATGFLPPAEFDVVVDALFSNPSVHGWEPAVDAQARIVRGGGSGSGTTRRRARHRSWGSRHFVALPLPHNSYQ